MNLSVDDMLVQLGRYLATQSGLVFVEPEASAKGDIYATQLPPRTLRNTPALSITGDPSAADEPLAATQRIAMVLHAQGRSNKEAIGMLALVQDILWPGGRPVVHTQAPHLSGTFGVPTQTGNHLVWRVIELSRVTEPVIVTPRSPDAQAVAEMAVEAHAVRHTATVTE